jgi:hypothetical protein
MSLQGTEEFYEISEPIYEYLLGEWDLDGLKEIIRGSFPEYDENKLDMVSQNVAEFYVSCNNGNGYTHEEFESILLGTNFELDED